MLMMVLAMIAGEKSPPYIAPEFNTPTVVYISDGAGMSEGTLLMKKQMTPDLIYRLVLVGDKTRAIYERKDLRVGRVRAGMTPDGDPVYFQERRLWQEEKH